MRTKTLSAALFAVVLSATALAEQLPYKNPKLSPEVRVQDLLGHMTLSSVT